MMKLTDDEKLVLLRAGFTLNQIGRMQQKFYNLFRVSPVYIEEVAELRRYRAAVSQEHADAKMDRTFTERD